MFTCSHTQAMNVVPSAKDTPQRPGFYMITNSTLQLHKTPGHNARAGSDQSKRGELRTKRASTRTFVAAAALLQEGLTSTEAATAAIAGPLSDDSELRAAAARNGRHVRHLGRRLMAGPQRFAGRAGIVMGAWTGVLRRVRAP